MFSKRLSSRRGHCSSRGDREGGVSGLGELISEAEELSGGIVGLSGAIDGSSGKGPVGGSVPA